MVSPTTISENTTNDLITFTIAPGIRGEGLGSDTVNSITVMSDDSSEFANVSVSTQYPNGSATGTLVLSVTPVSGIRPARGRSRSWSRTAGTAPTPCPRPSPRPIVVGQVGQAANHQAFNNSLPPEFKRDCRSAREQIPSGKLHTELRPERGDAFRDHGRRPRYSAGRASRADKEILTLSVSQGTLFVPGLTTQDSSGNGTKCALRSPARSPT